jgi:outer membrane protein
MRSTSSRSRHPASRTPIKLNTLGRLSALATAVLLALPGLAAAQSLQTVYEAARAYDATYLAARTLAESAQFKAEQAEAVANPQASLRSNATRTQLEVPLLGSGGTNAIGATATGTYALFNRTNRVNIDQARKALLSAQTDLETAEQDLVVRVSQAYFDVLASQDALGTQRTNKAAITEQLASAKRNFEVGTATITDTREAQAKFDLATAQEIAAENDLRTKRIALDQLVGQTNVTPRPLLTPVVLPPTVPAEPEAWVNKADAEHPAIRKSRLALDVAQLEIDKARGAKLPTLDAVGTAGATYNKGLGVSLPGTTKSATLGLVLNMPLYTGGNLENRVKETLSLEQKARYDLEAARRGVSQGTRVAFFNVQSGIAQVKALEAAESSSKLALEATQLGYKVGVRVNLDVLNAQTQLFTTQRDLAKARYDVLVGGLKLRQAAGGLTANDLTAVNRLLAP